MKRITGMLLLALVGMGGCSLAPTQPAAMEPAPTAASIAVQSDAAATTTAPNASLPALEPVQGLGGLVVADGRVVPVRSIEASFQVPGIVAEVLVQEGDQVAKGDPLMRLSEEQLSLALDEARASLAEARAAYEQVTEGATADERAVAQARLAQARAELKSTAGKVVPEDIMAVEAELTALRAELARVESGPRPAELQQAQAAVDEAQAFLEVTRDRFSAEKSLAKGELEQAAERLRLRQEAFSILYWKLHKSNGHELTPEEAAAEAMAKSELQLAETAVAQANVAFETALQQEINQIAVATARLQAAQAKFDQLTAGPEVDVVEKVKARIADAEARLKELQGAQREGDVESSQADVTIAAANLDRVEAGPRRAELANAEARLIRAEVALKRAELAQAQATLRAPIDGVVGNLATAVGETVSAQSDPAVVIADTSSWLIQTANLNELAVVTVREGDPVDISFYALPGFQLKGRVKRIMPLGSSVGRDTVYTVVIAPDSWDDRLRWNMTASVRISPQQ